MVRLGALKTEPALIISKNENKNWINNMKNLTD